MILESGRSVFGFDQSQGMLNRARAQCANVPIERMELHEVYYSKNGCKKVVFA